MKLASVVQNNCNCHPETCCCSNWKLLDREGKVVDYFDYKESADHALSILNASYQKMEEKLALIIELEELRSLESNEPNFNKHDETCGL